MFGGRLSSAWPLSASRSAVSLVFSLGTGLSGLEAEALFESRYPPRPDEAVFRQ